MCIGGQSMKKGDRCYIVENGRRAQEVEIVRYSGGFYTVRFVSNPKTALRVRADRLYKTENSAEEHLIKEETTPLEHNAQFW